LPASLFECLQLAADVTIKLAISAPISAALSPMELSS